MAKSWFLLAVIFMLTGCATTRAPSTVDNLQIKVAQLENAVKDQGKEMEALKFEVQDLSTQLTNIDAGTMREQVEEPSTGSYKKLSSGTGKTFPDDDVLRVAVDPEKVQLALKKAGYYDGIIDGKIGPKTKDAVKQFQKDHGLTADGVIGKKTWSEMKTYLK